MSVLTGRRVEGVAGGAVESGNLESEANYDNLSTKTLKTIFGL